MSRGRAEGQGMQLLVSREEEIVVIRTSLLLCLNLLILRYSIYNAPAL